MKTDFYTKALLTVIAISLFKIAFNEIVFVEPAVAQPQLSQIDVIANCWNGATINQVYKDQWVIRTDC